MLLRLTRPAHPPAHPLSGKGPRFRAMPIGTIEAIIQRIRRLVYGRADGMPNSLESMVLVSSLPTSPERISEPNHTQIENKEAMELPEHTELRRSPLRSKLLLAETPDGIPPSKSWTLRRCTRERAIKSVTRWLESVSGPELGSSQEQRSRSDSIQNHSAPNYFSNIHIHRKCINSAPVQGGIRDTEKIFQAPASPLTQPSWNGRDHDTHCDDYSCSQSATPEDASIASTMSSKKSLVENPRHSVPGVESELRVSIPVPDILYGYNLLGAFTNGEQAQINSMESSVFGNNDDLLFPFLAIEQTGDGPVSRGSLWVATNQCLGASASCVNIVERFNQPLRMCNSSNNNHDIDVKPVNSISFSTAMNGSEARLYVTWKHDEVTYHTAIVDSFLLQRPTDFLNFRRYVLNILDWGMGGRLTAIRTSLGHLLQESKKTTLRRDMDRSSPSEEQDGGRARKRRCGYRRADVGDTGSSTDPLTL
ncbi:hypothetical protein V500_03454 [Pseudogymnoascus sp. VKM F-4518 (FW-2643)]|nr:hypothetical protein V500_03454 [Pseudogymnoascus sp. VKM F-4518 (FW-2643)]